jgi:hypothetical protein
MAFLRGYALFFVEIGSAEYAIHLQFWGQDSEILTLIAVKAHF